MSPLRILRRSIVALACGALVPLAWAQFKIVDAEGKVTYTDRPTNENTARVVQLGRSGAVIDNSPEASLPLVLRQAVQRYPVTLYTTADCPSCDAGRKLLQTRGVPFTERRVGSEDDVQALEKAVGARTVPSLTIGAQQVRGYAETDWTAYLDVAGYPRESKLPRNYPASTVTAATDKPAAPKSSASAPATPAPRAEPVLPSGLRF